jgi:peptidoglycan/xylan/chitin deacetylase (PgdA/CDA1 family)
MHNGHRRLARGAALAGLAAAGLAVAHAGPGLTAIGPVRRRAFPRLAGLGRPDHVALTFDDGPDPASTPAFLDLLAARRLHATFFLLGSMAARSPRLAAEIAAAGHEIAVHGWDHRYTILRGPGAVFSDLARASDAVSGATGTRPRFFRPPYGVLSSGAVLAARRLELTPVLWSSWGKEWAARRHPGFGVRLGGGRPHRRRNDLASRLRLHLTGGGRLGRARRAALAAGRVLGPRAGRGDPG